MVNSCENCGNACPRKFYRNGKVAAWKCVTDDPVDEQHICDGWVKPCKSEAALSRAIREATERLEREDWQLSEVKLRKNYRLIE